MDKLICYKKLPENMIVLGRYGGTIHTPEKTESPHIKRCKHCGIRYAVPRR